MQTNKKPYIFISYRHSDTSEQAEKIKEYLSQYFDDQCIFLDRKSIEEGGDWQKTIQESIQESDIVLILIGPHWLQTLHERALRHETAWLGHFIEILKRSTPQLSFPWIQAALKELQTIAQNEPCQEAAQVWSVLLENIDKTHTDVLSPSWVNSVLRCAQKAIPTPLPTSGSQADYAQAICAILTKLQRYSYTLEDFFYLFNQFDEAAQKNYYWARGFKCPPNPDFDYLRKIYNLLPHVDTLLPDENDFVLYEVTVALHRNILVLPVLLDGANPLKENELSLFPGIEDLHTIQGILLSPDKQEDLESLTKTIEERTVLQIVQANLQMLHPRLLQLKHYSSKNAETQQNTNNNHKIDELIQMIREFHHIKTNKGYGYEDALLNIIENVGAFLYQYGVRTHDSDNQLGEYIYKQLTNIMQLCAESLSVADCNTQENTDPNDKNALITQAGYGYTKLVRLANVTYGANYAAYRYAGVQGLAFYREYRKTPSRRTVQLANNALQQQKDKKFKQRERWRVGIQMFVNTWSEFVSAEVIGGILLAFILAFAFAFNNTISMYYISPRPYLERGGDAMTCWNHSPYDIGSCTEGTLYELLGFVGASCLGIGLMQSFRIRFSQRHSYFLRYYVLLLGAAITIPLWARLSTQHGLNFDFIAQFIAVGLITLPGTVAFLTFVSWSSVLVGARKTRDYPEVQSIITVLATTGGMILTFFLLAAIVEKSRMHLLESIIAGGLWGWALGMGIWLGRYTIYKFERGKTSSAMIRVTTIIGCSIIAALLLGFVFKLWPQHNQFLSISIVKSSHEVIPGNYEKFQNLLKFQRFVFLGTWLGLGTFLAMDMLNDKMQYQGDTAPQKTERPTEISEGASL